MTKETSYREKTGAVFFAVILIVSMVALPIGLAGSAAAVEANGNVSASPDFANADGTTHTWSVTTTSAENSESVQGIVVDYDDDLTSSTLLDNVSQNDVTVEVDGQSVDVSNVNVSTNPEVAVELSNSIDNPDSGTPINVIVDDVNNPDSGTYQNNVTTFDTSFDVNQGNDSGGAISTAPVALEISSTTNGPFFDVTGLDAPVAAENGSTIAVSATITNTGDAQDTQTVEYQFDGTGEDSQSVTLNADESQEVTFNYELGQTGDFTHGIFTDNTSQTAGITVTDQADSAFITGDLRDAAGNQLDNASDIPITVEGNFSGTFQEIDASPVFVDGSNDEYTVEVPVESGGTDYRVSVDQADAEAATGTEFESFARTASVGAGSTERFDIRLRRVINPGSISVTPQEASAQADGDQTVTFTTTVLDDTTSEDPFEGATVELDIDAQDAGDIGVDPSQSVTTNADGEATFTLNSTAIQTADLTFTVAENPDLEATATATFTALDGTGEIQSEVRNVDSFEPIPDATVYAVQETQFSNNDIDAGVDSSAEFSGENELTFRVVDNESTPVSADDYRIMSNDTIERVDQLNETNRAVGSGFTLTNTSGTQFNVTVTPVEAGNYTVQVTNVSNPGDADFTDIATAEAPEDFTATAVSERAETGEAQPVASTISDGTAILGNLVADASGTEYAVIAERPGFTTEYKLETVVPKANDNDGTEVNFRLEEADIEPDTVDITQVGTHPPLAETGGAPNPDLITPFDNQSDAFSQLVPRDGTVDVLRVDASATNPSGDNIPVNTTVEVSLADEFDGAFVDALGGQVVENDQENATIVVATGADGTANVLLETAQNASTLSTQKTATLTEDTSVTDSSNVTFVGVVEYETSGSISGIVTNEDNEPLPNSVVYTAEFTDNDGNTFEISPVEPIEDDDRAAVLNAEFNITDVADDRTVTVTGADLAQSEGGYDFADFERISLNGSAVTLLTFPAEAEGQAQYTLPRVPATDDGVDYTEVSAVQLNSGDAGAADAVNVRPDFTQEANVVIVGAEPEQAVFSLSGLDPAEATLQEGADNVTFEAIVTNNGNIPDDVEVTAFVEDANGDRIFTSTQTVEDLGAGEGAVVEETVDTSGLAPGNYTHGFEVAEDSIEGDLTIEAADDGNSSEFNVSQYANENGVVDDAGLVAAITDWQNGNIEDPELLQVIQAWQSGEPVN